MVIAVVVVTGIMTGVDLRLGIYLLGRYKSPAAFAVIAADRLIAVRTDLHLLYLAAGKVHIGVVPAAAPMKA